VRTCVSSWLPLLSSPPLCPVVSVLSAETLLSCVPLGYGANTYYEEIQLYKLKFLLTTSDCCCLSSFWLSITSNINVSDSSLGLPSGRDPSLALCDITASLTCNVRIKAFADINSHTQQQLTLPTFPSFWNRDASMRGLFADSGSSTLAWRLPCPFRVTSAVSPAP